MKKMKVLLSVLLVVCMVVGFAPLHGTASAAKEDWEWYWSEEYRNRGHWNGWSYRDGWYELSDKWYQVDFSPVMIPVEVNVPGTTSNGTATAAGSTTQMVGTSFSYFYNEWAGTLIIRGTGEMPSFSKPGAQHHEDLFPCLRGLLQAEKCGPPRDAEGHRPGCFSLER